MKSLCPICSNTLLRHLGQSKILWFCLSCYQEMPNVDLVKFSVIREKSGDKIFFCNDKIES
jgi:hypothetical protein